MYALYYLIHIARTSDYVHSIDPNNRVGQQNGGKEKKKTEIRRGKSYSMLQTGRKSKQADLLHCEDKKRR